MLSLGKLSTHAMAAVILAALPFSALAQGTAKGAKQPVKQQQAKPEAKQSAKAAAKQPAKEQAKQPAKEQAKEQAKQPVKEPAQEQAQDKAKEPAQEAGKEQAKEQTQAAAPAKEPAQEQAQAEQAAGQAQEEVKTSPDDVMVKVNGVIITRMEVDRAVKVMLAQSQIPEPVDPEIVKKAQEAALDQLTAAELLYQQAAKLEIKDLEQQVTDKVAANRAKFNTDAEFEAALKTVDMNTRDMQDFTRKDIQISNFIEKEFVAKAEVTEAEAKKFYDENLEKYFKKPEMVRASHILIAATPESTPEERKKAKDKAQNLRQRAKNGDSFAEMAKEHSSCPSAGQGGDLGSFSRGEMVPEFEKVAFALKAGEISEVVETQYGYHVIRLTEKHEAKTESFEAAKPKITEFLKRDKVQKGIADYVEKLRKEAKIEKP